MASLDTIRRKAGKEDPDNIKKWVTHQLETLTRACDFRTGGISPLLIEDYCDTAGIPCYVVGERSISLATTYTHLLNHEEGR